jgi:hypothetical protein
MNPIHLVCNVIDGRAWRHYAVGLALGCVTLNAQATILAPALCRAFHQIAGNDLYSIAAGAGLVGLLIAHSMDEGDNKLKTAVLRIGLATTALVNVQTVTSYFTGTSWGC